MTGTTLILLVATGATFALWAFAAFRALFRLTGGAFDRARASGGSWPDPGTQLRELAAFFTNVRYRADRRRLGLLTPLLFALIALQLALK